MLGKSSQSTGFRAHRVRHGNLKHFEKKNSRKASSGVILGPNCHHEPEFFEKVEIFPEISKISKIFKIFKNLQNFKNLKNFRNSQNFRNIIFFKVLCDCNTRDDCAAISEARALWCLGEVFVAGLSFGEPPGASRCRLASTRQNLENPKILVKS